MITGFILSIAAILGIVLFSRSHHKAGEKIDTGLVMGLILGTMIGGACTIGTAQLAFLYGMSAWWYCLGGGIACLFLGLRFSDALRKEGGLTLIGIIGKEYGLQVSVAASLLNSLGTFINILSQLIAATSVIAVIFPSLSLVTSLALSALFMMAYVVIGGAAGAGMAGLVKLVLLYGSMLACGYLVVHLSGGFAAFLADVEELSLQTGHNFFDIFGRGLGVDLGACLSLIVGITTTQIYAQALTVARTDRVARTGALASGLLIPLIGAGGVLVGLFMRVHFPDIAAKTALTKFVMMYLPDFLSGIILGTLLITVVACGAGLALGIANIIKRDLLDMFAKKFAQAYSSVLVNGIIVAIFVAATICCIVLDSDIILNFAYLSMALRGAVVLAPLCFALWYKRLVAGTYAMFAVFAGPIIVIVFKALGGLPFDPLFLGIAGTFFIMVFGMKRSRSKDTYKQI